MNVIFTQVAGEAMQIANRKAHEMNHDFVGTEHILLGLVDIWAKVGSHPDILKLADIDIRRIPIEIEKLVARCPDQVTMGKLPLTPRSEKVIEFAAEESKTGCVGTDHLLVGLLREMEGVAAQVLMNLGLSWATVAKHREKKAEKEKQEDSPPPQIKSNTISVCVVHPEHTVEIDFYAAPMVGDIIEYKLFEEYDRKVCVARRIWIRNKTHNPAELIVEVRDA
jgi:ATP-dependent Clp protease ATP-binding subunit ClpA